MPTHKSGSDVTRPVIVMSLSEDVKVQEMLGKKFDIVYASGAGYKLLVVALGQVVAYVCSKVSFLCLDLSFIIISYIIKLQ